MLDIFPTKLSQASLAYFAKSHLSRARADFHADIDATFDMSGLVNFLESLVMTTTVLDKKYRDGVSTCVSLFDVQDHSAEEGSGKTKKRKSSKKIKPGKNGLYPAEETLIRKWWASHDDEAESGVPDSSKEELTRARISQLRIRETQLQMIIILEVLALKPSVSTSVEDGVGLPTALPGGVIESKEKPPKAKKPDHLTTLIDVHIDRLCIWQSVTLEEMKGSLGDSQSPLKKAVGPKILAKNADNILRDFCIEVIAPL